MVMEEENIKTQTLTTFTHDVLVRSIIDSIVDHSSDSITMESDLEKLTGMRFLCFCSLITIRRALLTKVDFCQTIDFFY